MNDKLAPALIAIGLLLIVVSFIASMGSEGPNLNDQAALDLGQAKAQLHNLSSGPEPGQSKAEHEQQLQLAQEKFQAQLDAIEGQETRGFLLGRVLWWVGALLLLGGVVTFFLTRKG